MSLLKKRHSPYYLDGNFIPEKLDLADFQNQLNQLNKLDGCKIQFINQQNGLGDIGVIKIVDNEVFFVRERDKEEISLTENKNLFRGFTFKILEKENCNKQVAKILQS